MEKEARYAERNCISKISIIGFPFRRTDMRMQGYRGYQRRFYPEGVLQQGQPENFGVKIKGLL